MANPEPSSEKRERILHALTQAHDRELETSSYDEDQGGEQEKHAGKRKGDKSGRTRGPEKGERRTTGQLISDCIHVNEIVLENKLLYFLFNAGLAGAAPYLSMYGLQWGLPPWHFGLVVALGLLAAFFFTPLWGFLADKLRWHRGMFWAIVLVWMAFTIAAVYNPKPELATCDVAKRQLLETLSANCIHGQPDPKLSEDGRKAYFEYLGRYSIAIQTWPEPCSVDLTQVCASYNETETIAPPVPQTVNTSAEDATDVAPIEPPPPLNSTESPKEETRSVPPGASSNSSEAPSVYVVLRETHLGWLYDEVFDHHTSLVVFIFAAVAGVAQISAFSLLDAGTLISLGEAHRDRYGWQRSFGTMGYALTSLVVAIMLKDTRLTEFQCGFSWEQTDYFVGAVVFAGFMTIGVLVSSCLQFQHNDMSSKHSLGQVTDVIFSRNYGCVFVTAFFVSLCNGALTTFLYWHLRKIGATLGLLVAGVIVHAVADMVTSYCTVWTIRKAGYHFPLSLGIAGYCLVYLSYALMSRPGWLVVVEIIHGASSAIVLNTMTSFLASSVALVSQASVQGLLSGVYWGLGPAAGTALFGFLVDVIGATLSFYCLMLVCVVYGLIFLIWNRHDLPMIDKYLPGEYQPLSTGSPN